MFQHEYGHYLQSQTFGLAYLFMVGVPSIISASQHNHHMYQKYERDASLRAFLYFNKYEEGFYKTAEGYKNQSLLPLDERSGWNFKLNPLLPYELGNNRYVDYYDIMGNHSFYQFGISPL